MLVRRSLRKASRLCPDGVYRLARFLGLRYLGMSPRQTAALIAWRLNPRRWKG